MKIAIAISAFLAIAPAGMAQSIAGVWQATITTNQLEIPFRIEFQGDGANVKGTLFNGDDKFVSTSGKFENSSLSLAWDYYGSKLEATLKGQSLEGSYARNARSSYPFKAVRYIPPPAPAGSIPKIDGLWITTAKSSKGEGAWQFIVRQSGPDVSGAILRIDGDTGTLSGTYKDGKFVMSHFSGVRPSLLEVTPAADGTLKLVLNGKDTLIAVRPAEARAKGVPEPDDPSRHTGVKDPSQPFRFSFHDLSGKLVSDTDPQFQGKVVLVNIAGSWCPNCHDEAPFLVDLYNKYHKQGLEIVVLAFEEADQLKDPVRLRAFIKRYGIVYPVLLCGETSEAKEKLSQAENWDAWPTTFILGRDGRVKAVHTGFPGTASGDLFIKAKKEFTQQIEGLLAQNARTSR
ncbi:MAG: TlpA disulfide reductase family protein [Bryobacteraceae bacterium]|jgi:thiol-disulfide isomerase/thioredoxin